MTYKTKQALNITGTLGASYRFTVYFKKNFKGRRRYNVTTYTTRYNVANNVNSMMRDTHRYAKIAVSNMIGESVYNYTFTSTLQDYVFYYDDYKSKNKTGAVYETSYLNNQIPETDRKKTVYGKSRKNKQQETKYHKTAKWKYEQKQKAKKVIEMRKNEKQRKGTKNKNKKLRTTNKKITTKQDKGKLRVKNNNGNKNKRIKKFEFKSVKVIKRKKKR